MKHRMNSVLESNCKSSKLNDPALSEYEDYDDHDHDLDHVPVLDRYISPAALDLISDSTSPIIEEERIWEVPSGDRWANHEQYNENSILTWQRLTCKKNGSLDILEADNLISKLDTENNMQKDVSLPWRKRRKHSTISFQNHIWIIGGFSYEDENTNRSLSSNLNDVWKSKDGEDWIQVTNCAPWEGRDGHTVVVMNNKLYLCGGTCDVYSCFNDVWISEDGLSWNKLLSEAPWPERWQHTAVVHNDTMFLFAGWGIITYNDVWCTKDGVTWTLLLEEAPWCKRMFHATIVFQGNIYIIGGYDGKNYLNDVWKSPNGIDWECVSPSSDWSPRRGHAVFSHMDRLFVCGGDEGSAIVADLWISENGGYTWSLVSSNRPWTSRVGHSAIEHLLDNNNNNNSSSSNSDDIYNSSSDSEISAKDQKQSERHSQDSTRRYIFIFGGVNEKGEYLNDGYRSQHPYLDIFPISNGQISSPALTMNNEANRIKNHSRKMIGRAESVNENELENLNPNLNYFLSSRTHSGGSDVVDAFKVGCDYDSISLRKRRDSSDSLETGYNKFGIVDDIVSASQELSDLENVYDKAGRTFWNVAKREQEDRRRNDSIRENNLVVPDTFASHKERLQTGKTNEYVQSLKTHETAKYDGKVSTPLNVHDTDSSRGYIRRGQLKSSSTLSDLDNDRASVISSSSFHTAFNGYAASIQSFSSAHGYPHNEPGLSIFHPSASSAFACRSKSKMVQTQEERANVDDYISITSYDVPDLNRNGTQQPRQDYFFEPRSIHKGALPGNNKRISYGPQYVNKNCSMKTIVSRALQLKEARARLSHLLYGNIKLKAKIENYLIIHSTNLNIPISTKVLNYGKKDVKKDVSESPSLCQDSSETCDKTITRIKSHSEEERKEKMSGGKSDEKKPLSGTEPPMQPKTGKPDNKENTEKFPSTVNREINRRSPTHDLDHVYKYIKRAEKIFADIRRASEKRDEDEVNRLLPIRAQNASECFDLATYVIESIEKWLLLQKDAHGKLDFFCSSLREKLLFEGEIEEDTKANRRQKSEEDSDFFEVSLALENHIKECFGNDEGKETDDDIENKRDGTKKINDLERKYNPSITNEILANLEATIQRRATVATGISQWLSETVTSSKIEKDYINSLISEKTCLSGEDGYNNAGNGNLHASIFDSATPSPTQPLQPTSNKIYEINIDKNAKTSMKPKECKSEQELDTMDKHSSPLSAEYNQPPRMPSRGSTESLESQHTNRAGEVKGFSSSSPPSIFGTNDVNSLSSLVLRDTGEMRDIGNLSFTWDEEETALARLKYHAQSAINQELVSIAPNIDIANQIKRALLKAGQKVITSLLTAASEQSMYLEKVREELLQHLRKVHLWKDENGMKTFLQGVIESAELIEEKLLLLEDKKIDCKASLEKKRKRVKGYNQHRKLLSSKSSPGATTSSLQKDQAEIILQECEDLEKELLEAEREVYLAKKERANIVAIGGNIIHTIAPELMFYLPTDFDPLDRVTGGNSKDGLPRRSLSDYDKIQPWNGKTRHCNEHHLDAKSDTENDNEKPKEQHNVNRKDVSDEMEKEKLFGGGCGRRHILLHGNYNDEEVVLKGYPIYSHEQRERLEREVSILSSIKHDAIIDIRAIVEDHDGDIPTFYLELPYCSGGDLRCWLHEHPEDNNLWHLQNLARQLICAVMFLHDRGIIHKDIKPENILVHGDGRLVLSDFELSKENLSSSPVSFSISDQESSSSQKTNNLEKTTGYDVDKDKALEKETYRLKDQNFGMNEDNKYAEVVAALSKMEQLNENSPREGSSLNEKRNTDKCLFRHKNTSVSAITGTPAYIAPEIQLGGNSCASFASDMYSCGVVIFFLHFPNHPTGPISGEEVENQIPTNTDGHLVDLLKQLLATDPSKRLDASNTLHHPYFRQCHVDRLVNGGEIIERDRKLEAIRALLARARLEHSANVGERLATAHRLIINRKKPEDVVKSLLEYIYKCWGSELSRPIKVIFSDEAGVDEGGLLTELYTLFFENILSHKVHLHFPPNEEISGANKNTKEEEEANNHSMTVDKESCRQKMGNEIISLFEAAGDHYNDYKQDASFPTMINNNLEVYLPVTDDKYVDQNKLSKDKGKRFWLQIQDDAVGDPLYIMEKHFSSFGRLLVKCLLDGRRIGSRFAPSLFKYICGVEPNLEDLQHYDKATALSLRWILANKDIKQQLMLDFSDVGYPDMGLVTDHNKTLYVRYKINHILVKSRLKGLEAIKKGFFSAIDDVFSMGAPFLKLLSYNDWRVLLCGEENVNAAQIIAVLSFENFNEKAHKNGVPVWLKSILKSYTQDNLRTFLIFVTGSPSLPVAAVGNIEIKIRRRPASNALPVAHTCFGHLDIPEYKSEGILRDKLTTAIYSGKTFDVV